jgi:hypothetical protein
MTRTDHQIIFTALAFPAVAGKETDGNNDLEKIGKLAGLLDTFCAENTERIFATVPLSSDSGSDAVDIDQAIERHINELREKETTRLPQDKNTLLKYYDRLQQRNARRTQSAFYETADERILADRVLKYLDEEIEDREGER